MADPGLSELVSTTLRYRSGKLKDNVSKNNALLAKLDEVGSIEEVDGGRTLVEELDYAENGSFKWYSGYEQLNIAPSTVITAAEFSWKQAAIAVSISGLEEAQNSGKNQVISLLKGRIKNAERTFENYLSNACYSDGTGDGGKQVGGLQLLVSKTPTSGTVGGIDRSAWSFWQNVKYDAINDGGAAVTASNIQKYMNTVLLRITRGTNRPKVIIADNVYYNAFWSSLQSIQRLCEDPKMAALGFRSLQYAGIPVVFDGGYQTGGSSGSGCPTKTMYFINPDFVKLKVHKNRNMKVLDTRTSINQDAEVRLMVWCGNMTLSNAFLQGVLFE